MFFHYTPHPSEREDLNVKKTTVCWDRAKKKKSNSNIKKVKNTVNNYMKYAKTYQWKKMNKLFYKKSKIYGYPTTRGFIKGYKKTNKKNIKWKIIDIDKEGKSYIVYAKIKRPNFYNSIYNIVYDEYNNGLYNGENGYKIGENIIRKIEKRIKKGTNKTKTDTVKFFIIKSKGKWKIKKKNKEITDIALGYYWSAYEDAEYDFLEDIGK